MNDYLINRHFGDKKMESVISVLSKYFGEDFQVASEYQDTKEATDLISESGKRIAVRIRHAQYFPVFGDEFTIRTKTSQGKASEWQKIIKGYGDYLFYAFMDDEEATITHYTLIDLHEFRWWIFSHMATNKGKAPGIFRTNCDGTNFRAFNLADLSDEIIEASGQQDLLD
jgi:hypothetical protein